MILVKLMGGLGNQMFQYAAGLSLANEENTALKLDLTFLNNSNSTHTIRKFELDCLNIKSTIIEKREVENFEKKARLFKNFKISKLDKFLFRNLLAIPKIYSYHGPEYKSEIFENGSNCLIEGYWQNEKYFNRIRKHIINEFTFKQFIIDKNLALVQEMKSCNSISLHVRRGDYITNKDANQFHGTCSLQYYSTAIQYILAKVENPFFYIFSDDTEWVRKNLYLDEIQHKIIEGNSGEKSYNDMYLMSNCNHNIIANSSFSWWAAWLNNFNYKIVIAPKQWYSSDIQNDLAIDLIPKKWLRM